ncbi:MAG: CopG family transcriptional regulator [Rhodanobacteraceae bacterium]|nr:MAG: CopG family transcriptional regulator [Rhodanobacteraceae bacterium]
MRSEYDFSNAKRGPVIASPGKTRITIMLDNDVLDAFRERAEAEGRGYQTAINEALRNAIDADAAPVTVATLRKELRRALKRAAA